MSQFIDRSRSVRAGDDFDVERLRAYLDAQLEGGCATLSVEQFPGGHSNLTYLVHGPGWEHVLRRPPFGSKVRGAHDMGREYRVLSRLAPIWDKAPRPIVYCEDEAVMGCPFYLMERRSGVIVRRDAPADLGLDAATAEGVGLAVVDTLAELHGLDYVAAGMGDLGKPEGYVARQVTGWTERYAAARTDDAPAAERVARWLADSMPADGAAALIHNDFKLDNVILDPGDLTRVTTVLDWEMATIGDPLMDLGTMLCYWVEATDSPALQACRFGPTHLPGMPTRAQVAARYAERRGRELDNILFYYCFGLFKTAVVAQQIYYRYFQGLTKDARFAQLVHGVRALLEQAERSLAKGSI